MDRENGPITIQAQRPVTLKFNCEALNRFAEALSLAAQVQLSIFDKGDEYGEMLMIEYIIKNSGYSVITCKSTLT